MKIAIGNDHAGYKYKLKITEYLKQKGHAVKDFGSNCEQMVDYDSGQQHTQHTTELVPLVYIGERPMTLDPAGGKLADIAPTLLGLMDLEQPEEMTGTNLASAAA